MLPTLGLLLISASLRVLSFGRPLNRIGFPRSYQTPSHRMLGRLFRSRFLENFRVIDARNYYFGGQPNVFPNRWPAKTSLWGRANAIGLETHLKRLQSRLGECLFIDPDYPGDHFISDDIPFGPKPEASDPVGSRPSMF